MFYIYWVSVCFMIWVGFSGLGNNVMINIVGWYCFIYLYKIYNVKKCLIVYIKY